MVNKVKCFHLSHVKNRKSILLKGLEPRAYKGGVISYKSRLFFSTSRKDLAFDYVNFEQVDVWEFFVDQEEMKVDQVSSMQNHYYISRGVSPDELKLVQCF